MFSSIEDLGQRLGKAKYVIDDVTLQVADRTVEFSDADYEAALRMRLDTSLLPKPFQLSALTSRDLHLESGWERFTVRSPGRLPVTDR